MNNYKMRFKPEVDIDTVWQLLAELNVIVLYSDENSEGDKEIYIQLPSECDLEIWAERMPGLLSLHDSPLPSIDWEKQWQLHGHNFYDGLVHIDLTSFGYLTPTGTPSIIKLEPGPGFGDLSHPTTALILQLISREVEGKTILDIGCGSGILSLAALTMGAKKVFAIDIDFEALEHTRKNAHLNELEKLIVLCYPHEISLIKDSVVVLINMISSEQIAAWKSVEKKFPAIEKIFSSGVRTIEKKDYLNLTAQWGWRVEKCLEQDGWLGFEFSVH